MSETDFFKSHVNNFSSIGPRTNVEGAVLRVVRPILQLQVAVHWRFEVGGAFDVAIAHHHAVGGRVQHDLGHVRTMKIILQ